MIPKSNNITVMIGDPFQARRVLLKWERLRIVYNLILILVVAAYVIFFSKIRLLINPHFLLFLLPRVVFANILFMAGPTVEVYIRWLGLRHVVTTVVLFTLGLLAAIPLAFMSLVMYSAAHLD